MRPLRLLVIGSSIALVLCSLLQADTVVVANNTGKVYNDAKTPVLLNSPATDVPAMVADAGSVWRQSQYLTTLENSTLRARFQAGNLFELYDLVTGQTLLYKDPAELDPTLLLFGSSSVNLDSADVTQDVQSDSVETTYSWPDGTSWNIGWSFDGGDLVLQNSAQSPSAVDGFYITLTGCNMTSHNLTAIDGYGLCHTMTAPYSGALMVAHGGTQKNAMPWTFCQPMVILFEGNNGGWVIEGRDPDIGPSNMRPFGEGQTADVVISRAFPETLATQAPVLFEVRIRTYDTLWQDAVDPYVAWMENDVGFVPIDQKTNAWIQDIFTQSYVTCTDFASLNALAQRVDPCETYLGRQAEYRNYGFDKGFPDYSVAPLAVSWLGQARSLGFHVGVHTNIAAIDRGFTDLVEQMEPGLLQIGTDGNGEPIWSGGASFVHCSSAYPPWRGQFIDAIEDVVAAGADVIYLDEAGPLGRFVVNGITATQGVMIMEQEIMDAYPGVVLQTEGFNPCISRHAYFALVQHPPIHQLSGYIFSHFIKLIPESYMYSPIDLQNFDDYASSGYIIPGSDTNRSESWLEIIDAFQQFDFVPNSRLPRSSNQFSGFSGSNQAEAYFEKTATSRYLMVYRPYHVPEQYGVRYTNITQWLGPGAIENWLVFDDTTNNLLGLDPARTYWFDETVVLDQDRFHVTAVPPDYLPYQNDNRRTIPQEIGLNESNFRLFFSGNGQMNMFVSDGYDAYLDDQEIAINRQTDSATATISASQSDPSVLRVFQRSEQVLQGYWVDLFWSRPQHKISSVSPQYSLYPPYGIYTNVSGEAFIIGRFPFAQSIRLQGSYGMHDTALISKGDGVIKINGSEVMRIDPGQGPPYDRIPFDIDITSFRGQYAMLEFGCDGDIRLFEGADWDAPQFVVTAVVPPNDCAAAIAQGYGYPGDFSGDCYVDLADLAILLQDWLRCVHPTHPECEHSWQ